MALELNELLELRGFASDDARLVRHADGGGKTLHSAFALWRTNRIAFELYQSLQNKEKFQGANYLISFVKTPTNETLFVGIYQVQGVQSPPVGTINPSTNLPSKDKFLYNLSLTSYAEDWIGKLTIEWGKNYQTWVQYANTQFKNVKEIRLSYEEQPFPGYFHFRCKLSELNLLPINWIERLRSAQGVYVLTSLKSGQMYVGSAAGRGGFYDRWAQHNFVGGAAVGLQAHNSADYQVAILQVASGFESKTDIVRVEHHWMDKLQTRGMGLNGQPRKKDLKDPQGLP